MIEVVNYVVGSSSSVPAPTNFDAGSPLYIHPSDNTCSVLVPVPFDGVVKNKLRFINGECMKPSPQSPDYRQLERSDAMVTSWILNSLSKDITDSDRYDQTNGAKLYQIQKEINDLNQGILDITSYYTRMKKLWEELTTLSAKSICSCTCTCGAKETMHKAEQDRRLIQFLMGLNEVYTIIRGNMLMMNPLPSMGQAFALLVQEEKQREFKPNNQFSADSSSSLNVSSSSSRNSGGPSGVRGFQINYANSNVRTRPYGDHCKRVGHTKDRCYKIHGYPSRPNANSGPNNQPYNNYPPRNQYNQNQNSNPSQYKGHKGKGTVANVHGELLEKGESSAQSGPVGALSQEQYHHLGPSLKRPLEIGKIHDGLYFLCSKCLQKNNSIPQQNHTFPCLSSQVLNTNKPQYSSSSYFCFPSTDIKNCIVASDPVVKDTIVTNKNSDNSCFTSFISHANAADLLWHFRLGHVPFVKMRGLTSIPVKFSTKQPFFLSNLSYG
nr:uncharacterized protein LOC104645967 [Solanum lycopersicum]